MMVDGNVTRFEKITTKDAEIVCYLRNKNNRFLSSQNNTTTSEQKNWIDKNLKNSDNYYFKIIEKESEKIVGTISLYDIKNYEAEFGRYICENPMNAIESEFLILKFAFENLGLNRIYCRTMKENVKVWNQHYKYGFQNANPLRVSPDDSDIFIVQEIFKDQYLKFDYKKIFKIIQTINKR
jgi:RimJ/RimL family protein N-acetyltransferase